MGKKKGGKKSKIEGVQRSRSASKCEPNENQENLPSKDEQNDKEQTVEAAPVTVAEKIKVELIRSDSNDRCASPSNSSALDLLAEIVEDNKQEKQDQSSIKNATEMIDDIVKDNKQEKLQHQSSIKNATEMINEIDQGLDVLSMEAITMDSEGEEPEPTKPISEENKKKDEAITSLPQSTQIQCLTCLAFFSSQEAHLRHNVKIHGVKEEVTDTKPDETSDQPDKEYGFMEAMTLDSDEEDEVEHVPKTVPEIVPNRQKSLEPENEAQDEDDVLNIESITMDSEDKDEVKIEVKEDKTPQAPEPTSSNKPEINDTKIIEPEKKFAEEVITVDVLDMEGMTMDSEDEDEAPEPNPVQNQCSTCLDDTKIIESEKKSAEEELDVLDMEGMTMDSDQDNEDEVETIPQKVEPENEKTDATLNGEIEILSQEENLNEKQDDQDEGAKVSGTSSLTIQLKRTKSGAKIQDTYFIKRQNGMYDQVKDKNLVIVNAQALAQICQEYDIKVEKFFEAPSSQIEVSNSTVSQIKKAELKLSGKMSH